MNKVLVTGAAGFIGSNICERLLDMGDNVIGIDNFDNFYNRIIKEDNISELISNNNFRFTEIDICNNQLLNQLNDFDLVIHLAGKAGVNFSITDVEAYLQTNIIGTKNILELMRKVGCKNIIYSSSSSVYGKTSNSSFGEDDNTNFPLTPYATSKRASELLLYNYHNVFGINAVVLRLFSVYGKNQRPDLVFSKFSNKILNNQPIEVYSQNDNSRDYTHISDVAEGILKSISYLDDNSKVYEIFNIGNSRSIPIKIVVEALYKYFRKSHNIIYTQKKEGDMPYTKANILKAREILGYNPKVSFEEGVKEFCSWFITKFEQNGK